jgi:hypothetical protein
MELFLNILWVMIALGALGVWRIDWNRQPHGHSRRPLLEWTALGCALVLLFFAVSLSDDLRAATILVDDCASGRHHSMVSSCGHGSRPNLRVAHKSFATVPSVRSSDPVLTVSRISPVTVACANKTDLSVTSVRGPPCAL